MAILGWGWGRMDCSERIVNMWERNCVLLVMNYCTTLYYYSLFVSMIYLIYLIRLIVLIRISQMSCDACSSLSPIT